jgi:prepilin peptidase CpaA
MLTPAAGTAASALPVLLVWAGAADIFERSIPNALVLLLAASFAVFAATAGMNAAQVLSHAVCAGAILAGGFLLFSAGSIGGGDAKLLAGAALWFGFKHILPFLAGVALAGGVLSLAYLSANAIRVQLGAVEARPATIPYGAAIAAGALAAIPDWLAAF